MIDRRQFIQTGLAGSMAGALGGAALLTGSLRVAARTPLPLHLALFDERFFEGLEFGYAMRTHGVRTSSTRGDITETWYSDLHPRWIRGPAAVAGLTAHEPLFCLERLAWDHGMRVVYEGIHRLLPDGRVTHAPSTPGPELTTSLSRGWASSVATLVAQMEGDDAPALPIFRHDMERPGRYETPGTSSARENARLLYSWVIAPATRRESRNRIT
jgi:hypothetical protein